MNRHMALGAAIPLALVALFLLCFERTSQVEERSPAGEAAPWRYLALERMMERLNVGLERRSNWHRLPPSDQVVWIASTRFSMSESDAQIILSWVNGGGTLVVEPDYIVWDRFYEDHFPLEEESEADGSEPLEDSVAGEASEAPTSDVNENLMDLELAEDDDEPLFGDDLLLSHLALSISDEEREEEAQVSFDGASFALELTSWPRLLVGYDPGSDRSHGAVAPAGGELDDASLVWVPQDVAQFALGAGHIIVVMDSEMLTNRSIGEHDHAEFVWRVLSLGSRVPTNLRLVVDVSQASIYTLLATRGWPLLLSLLALLAVSIWSRATRFGPLLPSAGYGRRGVLEHVEAVGRFLWRVRLSEVMLESHRLRVMKRAEILDPAGAHGDRVTWISSLAARAGLPPAQLAAALRVQSVETPGEFTKIVQTLEQLRNSTRQPERHTGELPANDESELNGKEG